MPMPECSPFCGWRYNPEKVEIEKIVAPPYDVVSEEEKLYYQNLSSYNVFHLELPESYSKAQKLVQKWIEEKILIKDPYPSIYFYELSFPFNQKTLNRKGIILLVKISPFNKGLILPHEKTYSKVTSDRFKLLKHTYFQFSQIFGLYEDPYMESLKDWGKGFTFLYEIKIKEETHKLYKLDNPELIKKLLILLFPKKIYIADGHHRYITALKFKSYLEKLLGKNEKKDYNFTVMYLCPLEDENLLMLPTHRVFYVENLQKFLSCLSNYTEVIKELPLEELTRVELHFKEKSQEFGVYTQKSLKIFRIKPCFWEKILQKEHILWEVPLYNFLQILKEILKKSEEKLKEEGKVEFTSDLQKVKELVDKNLTSAVGIIFPTISPLILKKITQANKLMPHKSTFFYPKILTGMVFHQIKGEILNYEELQQ